MKRNRQNPEELFGVNIPSNSINLTTNFVMKAKNLAEQLNSNHQWRVCKRGTAHMLEAGPNCCGNLVEVFLPNSLTLQKTASVYPNRALYFMVLSLNVNITIKGELRLLNML